MFFTKEHNQQVAREMRKKGFEVTPDEVGEKRTAMIAKFRKLLMENKCCEVAELDDEALYLLLIVCYV